MFERNGLLKWSHRIFFSFRFSVWIWFFVVHYKALVQNTRHFYSVSILRLPFLGFRMMNNTHLHVILIFLPFDFCAFRHGIITIRLWNQQKRTLRQSSNEIRHTETMPRIMADDIRQSETIQLHNWVSKEIINNAFECQFNGVEKKKFNAWNR